MEDKKIKNNKEEDTLYFGDIDKRSYESHQRPYSEDDMYENYKPLTNINSIEYDEGDYAYSNYDYDDEDDKDNRKKIIIAYIVVLFLLILGIGILFLIFK